ncbi:Glutamate-cysteine ligase catalytic subunit [Penicillium angulare]|uniref:Glutamate-cysteine ligase catalytic subunit n=1 Tax=Penicillium angulare TaxID=116970 RepID=UPI00254083F9|nr:Glutamate-cysteine ligase catalytic subunit [Penicillium angulare]KAJ5288065.1 Glutamate-cysteine ligase catalytic subunit [Penicillium angulare]
MTAATPVWKGHLVDSNCRWQRYGDLVDDRSLDEKGSIPPRWTWEQSYISTEQPSGLKSHQLLHSIDDDVREYLIEGGMDGFLADHFASILTRDPLLLTEADLKDSDPPETRLFETLYGCVWHPVRFKPPTGDRGPGWRVEFRPMEAQLTDFENAAFAIFAYFVSRAITVLRLKFYIPVEKLSDAWATGQDRGAVIGGRFWFRKTGWLSDSDKINPDIIRMLSQHGYHYTSKESYAQMTVDEVVNGEGTINGFPGLLLMLRCYFEYVGVPMEEQEQIARYLNLIRDRARGRNPTPATWIREFIGNHKDYAEDSYISEKVCYDMMRTIIQLNEKKSE